METERQRDYDRDMRLLGLGARVAVVACGVAGGALVALLALGTL